MTKDSSDDRRIFDMGDDAHAAFTNRTGQHINAEDAHYEGSRGGRAAGASHGGFASVAGPSEMATR